MSTEIVKKTNKEVNSLQKVAESLTVASPVQVEEAEALLKSIKGVKAVIVTRKEEITRPLMASLASVRDMFRGAETTLTEAERVVKTKMLAYHEEEGRKAQEERERLAARVEKGTMRSDTAVKKMGELDATPMKTRTLTKVRVVDEALVPREYLVPDLKKITEAVLREGKTVAGCETYKEKVVSV